MTNNYIKILLHLKQFEGDGKIHEIENLLVNLDKKEEEEIFIDLSRENLIILSGGKTVGFGISLSFEDGNLETFDGDNIRYEPFAGRITLKGLRYLKEHFEMTNKNKYNINVEGNSTANVIIGSPGATINNKSEIIDKVKTIIKTIENDNSIDNSVRQNAIGDFNQLLKEIEQGDKNQLTIDKIFSLGGNISSIGSLVISLIQLLAAH